MKFLIMPLRFGHFPGKENGSDCGFQETHISFYPRTFSAFRQILMYIPDRCIAITLCTYYDEGSIYAETDPCHRKPTPYSEPRP